LTNAKSDFDVAIVGGGPAGSAAALSLLKYSGLRVAVVESTNYKELRVGETVSPSLLPILRYLDVEEDFLKDRHLPSYGINSVWGTSQMISRNFLFTGQGNGWHLDRKKFDYMMASKVRELGGSLLTWARIVRFSHDKKKNWQFTISDKHGKKLKISTRFVIDASGKRAVFARKLGTRWKIYDRLIGVASFFKLGKQVEQAMTIESVADGWWYSSPLPQDKMVAVFMTDSDIGRTLHIQKPENWLRLLDKTTYVKKSLNSAKMVNPPKIYAAHSQVFENIRPDHWIPAGEAAVSFDPLASRGIGYAMTSGIEAARAVRVRLNHADGKPLSLYLKNLVTDFGQYLKSRTNYYSIERRWKDEPFWNRRTKVS